MVVNGHRFGAQPRNSFADIFNRLTDVDDDYVSWLGETQRRRQIWT